LSKAIDATRQEGGVKPSLSEFLDLAWIEQRIYDLEERPQAPMDARNIGHIFTEESNKVPDENLAAIW
jgi:hypothetical protein